MKIHSTMSSQTSNMENLNSYEFYLIISFKGQISKIEDNKFLIKSVYEIIDDNKIRITYLPVGTWTMPYTTFLEGLMDSTDKNGKANSKY